MNPIRRFLLSSHGRKTMMALTGLFLILFLVVHLIGNLQLLAGDGGRQFNEYSHFMSHSLLIQTVSKLNFAFIILHVLYSLWLSRQAHAARPQGYEGKPALQTATWSSRNMGILGTVILLFLIVHLKGFWYELKFGAVPSITYAGAPEPLYNAYEVVRAAYAQAWYAGFYILSMVFLGFHLHHGFQSAFHTLGLSNYRYKPLIRTVGTVFAILVPMLFALIPAVMHLQSLGY
ncbi:MAG: succinate dehydrogenase cytochrome b subunit [Sphingomonadales bacterium]|nr:succinate dehydrogenase cytochrome b subunit [Sphingomonadales bacterium]